MKKWTIAFAILLSISSTCTSGLGSSKRGAAAASSGRPKRGFRAFFSCVKTHDT